MIDDYNTLEILGDAVIKLIFILKLFKVEDNILRDAGDITKTKQHLENDETLSYIAKKYFFLHKYILRSKTQSLRGTHILADVLEALCGAIYLDSDKDLKVVEKIIVSRFYQDWNKIIKSSRIWNKNRLIEYLQKQYRITPKVISDFENYGTDHAPKWIARRPRIMNRDNEILIYLPDNLSSEEYKTKKEAEQDLYFKIYQYLKGNS
ncbi:MAG: hypothetical protein GF383_13510 [Candidatus Lokiarchaeota archaeon]|nr:hypothetical protein [Candidatus Lokiarchaeota archaeon]MBD3342218.1 hypothetical protein [Candidatus Lokiarchaeota archaeon]